MRRRAFLKAGAAALALASAPVAAQTGTRSLRAVARTLRAQPYRPPAGRLPPPFAGLSYDAYRAIRPIAGRAAMLPLGRGYAVDLLPPGLFFPDPVAVELPAEDGFAQVPFSPALFDFAPRYFDDIPARAPGAGFSGVRLRHPVNSAGVLDEVLVMQGASYFRAIGRAMVYGLSARALAIGTGGPGPEEFPRIIRTRMHPAAEGALGLEAVIDSPALTGHMEMLLQPGADTVCDLAVTVLPRRRIADIGIAPLTSMYLKGPMRASVADDFRPRVHDSDALLIETGSGERLWRPIANPAQIETSAFIDDGPSAFGLWQTPRDFTDYEDSEARYHDRPSARVAPLGHWGRGAVMLVEIPTADEFVDNIVAFWRPEVPLEAGSAHRFDYRLTWTRAAPQAGPPLKIRQSRSGHEHDRPGTRRFVVDFAGVAPSLRPELSASDGTLEGVSLFALPAGRGTRVTFLLTPGSADSIELRLVLRDGAGGAVSPVWLHRWTRARDGGV